jgi:hypothetical protein
MSREEVLWGIGLPALLCCAVLVAVFRPWGNAAAAVGGRWAGANALALGLAVAFLAGRDWGIDVPPKYDWEWLVYVVVGLAVAIGYGAPVGGHGKSAWTVRVLVVGLASYLIIGTKVDDLWIWRSVTAAIMMGSITGLEKFSERGGGAGFSLAVALATGASSLILLNALNSRYEILAHLAVAFAACLAVVALLAWWRPTVSLGSGGVLVVGVCLPGMLMAGLFLGRGVPIWCFLLAALSPAAFWVTELPVAQKLVAQRPEAIRGAAIVVPAAVAAAVAWFVSG